MLRLKTHTATLLVACLIATGSHASASLATASGGMIILGFSTLIDVSITRQTDLMKKDYNRSQMVVVGYQIDKVRCQVCQSLATRGQCIDTPFKAQLKNEFLAYFRGVQTIQHVLSESICGVDEDDANITASKRFPLGTTTAIWYKKTNPSIWQKADHTELTFISKLMFFTGSAAFLIGFTLHQFEQHGQQTA